VFVAILSVGAFALSIVGIVLTANEADKRQADTADTRRQNIANICDLFQESHRADNQQVAVLVGILRRNIQDTRRLARVYRQLGIDPVQIRERAARDAARLEAARPGTLECSEGRIRRVPPEPIP
jgi:hypothetical protein